MRILGSLILVYCYIYTTHSILVYTYTLTAHYFDCILVSMKTLILVATLLCTACSTQPRLESQGQLFDQIPNWDRSAILVCGRLTDRC